MGRDVLKIHQIRFSHNTFYALMSYIMSCIWNRLFCKVTVHNCSNGISLFIQRWNTFSVKIHFKTLSHPHIFPKFGETQIKSEKITRRRFSIFLYVLLGRWPIYNWYLKNVRFWWGSLLCKPNISIHSTLKCTF